MDQDPFTASLFKWDPRSTLAVASAVTPPSQPPPAPPQLPPYLARGLLAGMRDPVGIPGPAMGMGMGMGMGMSMGLISSNNNNNNNNNSGACGLEELFQAYGIRYYTAAKIAEMGFTVSTLVDMKEEELDDMMNSLSHIFRWDLLVGERYGIKAAVRAERRRLEEIEESRRHGHHHLVSFSTTPPPDSAHQHPLDALSQEGLSEEPGVQEKEVVGSGGGGGGNWEMIMAATAHHHHHHQQQQPPRKKQTRKHQGGRKGATTTHNNNNANMSLNKKGQASRVGIHHSINDNDDDMEEEDEVDDDDLDHEAGRGGGERQREHPFIVTEPGEVARGKKNGLDYLFHLYEQCREFLIQVQNIAKERGEKCPTKVTNQVFRYANKAGATYINKPKMRHYVHCYALHCLDEETSNALRRAFKERGENVGAWRQACYKPLVAIAARQGWDIDAIFNSHPRLSIWYVPTKLRQLCHAERSGTAACSSATISAAPHHHLHF